MPAGHRRRGRQIRASMKPRIIALTARRAVVLIVAGYGALLLLALRGAAGLTPPAVFTSCAGIRPRRTHCRRLELPAADHRRETSRPVRAWPPDMLRWPRWRYSRASS